MRLQENSQNNTLEFILEEKSTDEQKRFHAKIANYALVRRGASIFINQKNDNKLMGCFNTFDNTFLVCDPNGYELAAEFGTKRFPIGDAHKALDDKQVKAVGAIPFKRDLLCPVSLSKDEKVGNYKVATLKEVLDINKADKAKFYDDSAELFGRCADFTPGKKDEYLLGDKKADKFCRLNLENQQVKDGIVTDQIFLLDEKNNNQVVGTVSATVAVNKNGVVDVYFYDEIVDYFTKLSAAEKQQLDLLYQDQALSEDAKKLAISKIVDPKRMEIMVSLFAAARQKISTTIRAMFPDLSEQAFNEKMQQGLVRGFIRAADGRVPLYVSQLGCSETNTTNFVIHGGSTAYTKMLDAHVKSWANKKLVALNLVANAAAASIIVFGAPKPAAVVNTNTPASPAPNKS